MVSRRIHNWEDILPPVLELGVLGLPGAPFAIPLKSGGTVDTEGEKAGEGSVSRLLGSVKVISGSASAIVNGPALSSQL